MTNQDTYKIARIIKDAICIRENSYFDETHHYGKTIRTSVEEAFELQTDLPDSVIHIVYTMLSHDWNDASSWADHQLAITQNVPSA